MNVALSCHMLHDHFDINFLLELSGVPPDDKGIVSCGGAGVIFLFQALEFLQEQVLPVLRARIQERFQVLLPVTPDSQDTHRVLPPDSCLVVALQTGRAGFLVLLMTLLLVMKVLVLVAPFPIFP